MVDNFMLFGMARPTKSFKVTDNIIVSIPVYMMNYQKSVRSTSLTGIFTKLPIGLYTALPPRIIFSRIVKIFSVTSIMAKLGTIFRRSMKIPKISFGLVIKFSAILTNKFHGWSFIMGNLSFHEWPSTHTNSISTNISSVNGPAKMSKLASAGKKKK